MSAYRLRLLGSFELSDETAPLLTRQERVSELIALLALNRGAPVSRQQIGYQFWPDSSEKQARTNVRRLIHRLKNLWPDAEKVIDISRESLCWRATAPITVDVHQLDQALDGLTEEPRPTQPTVDALIRAADRYQGDLLPDLYSDWVLVERERLRGRYSRCLAQLTKIMLDMNQAETALPWAKQLLRFDPLREASYRRLMRIHAALNDRAAALHVYHACAELFQKELGVEPGPSTQALYRRLMDHPGQQPGDRGAEPVPKPANQQKLVGRGPEWNQTLARWRTAQQGAPGMVTIWGEAGIGKTRLAEELMDWVNRQGHVWASSRSYAAQGALSYAPIAEWLASPRLRPRLEALDDLWRVELGRLLPDLLAERPDLPAPGPLNEDWQRRRFYEGMRHALFGQTIDAPLLLHLDDLQWTDAQTLEALSYLLHTAGETPFLLLTTIRREEAADNLALGPFLREMAGHNLLSELSLSPLSPEACKELAAQTVNRALSPDELTALCNSSEGHPLFLIETIRATGGQGTTRAPTASPFQNQAASATVPPKIFDLIARRLGQFSESAQQLAAVASVIGREFSYPVLHRASGLDELTLVDALDELWQGRIVREQGEEAYDFSHDRIREVAYACVSRARRRLFHRQVARALEAHHANAVDPLAGDLARHYQAAGDAEKASAFYERAGQVAQAQNALARAESFYKEAIKLVPPSDWQRQFDLRQRLSDLYEFYTDHAARKKVVAEQEALLFKMLADPTLDQPAKDRAQMMVWLNQSNLEWSFKGDAEAMLTHCRQVLSLAQKLCDLSALTKIYMNMGYTYWTLTDMAAARTHFVQAIEYAQAAGEQSVEATSLEFAAATGMFSGMLGDELLGLLDRALMLAKEENHLPRLASLNNKFGYWEIAQGTGQFEKSAQHYAQGLDNARKLGNILLASNILRNIGHLEACRGDYRAAQIATDEARRLGGEMNNPLHVATAIHFHAFSLIQQGAFSEAAEALREAETALAEHRFYHIRVKFVADRGLLIHLQGRDEEARTVLTDGLALASRHGDARYQGLFCVRLGYVLAAMNQPAEAEEAYRQGIDYHLSMEQPYFAAYGQAGLARLHHQAGETAEAETLARHVWTVMTAQQPEATVESARAFVTCARILAETDPELAVTIARTAHDQLTRRAATIDDPQRRENFWQIPDHQAVLTLHEPTTV